MSLELIRQLNCIDSDGMMKHFCSHEEIYFEDINQKPGGIRNGKI